MTEFTKAQTNTKQGDIGEARAIYEYTKMGYSVSRTIFDSTKYDLIIDNGESLKRVQVKTSKCRNTKDTSWQVCLETKGGNTTSNTRISRKDSDYDILFVLTDDGRCWSIPIEYLDACTSMNIGNKKYNEFEIK